MKALALLLVASLLANAAMLVVVAAKKQEPVSSPRGDRAKTAFAAGSATRNSHGSNEAKPDGDWAHPTRENLPGLVARLQKAGYPPEIVRAIVASLVNELFAGKRNAFDAAASATPFWRGSSMPLGAGKPPSADVRQARRDLERERKQLLDELLGPDLSGEMGMNEFVMRSRFGSLPLDKLERISAINTDYGDLRREITVAGGLSGAGVRIPADTEKLALIDREERADLEAILTPEELFEYDVRSSNAAAFFRNTLVAFQPTEDEFRAIFRALQIHQGSSFLPTDGSLPTMMKELALQLEPQFGPVRIAEYEFATNGPTQMIARIFARFDVPLQKGPEVTAIQTDIMQRFSTLRSNRSLNPSQQRTELASLAAEADQRLKQAIGEKALPAYRQYSAWLQNLNPSSSPNGR